ncbi:MAG TPA: hypothetical protein VF661_06000, partial [Actinomycetales bacterium]
MSDQLEPLLRETFDEDAGRAPAVGALAERSRAASRRRRRTTVASAIGASLGVAALVTAVALQADRTDATPTGPAAVEWP